MKLALLMSTGELCISVSGIAMFYLRRTTRHPQ